MHEVTALKLNNSDILRRRAEVSKMLISSSSTIKSSTLKTISTADLRLMFRLYDEIFFENWFMDTFKGKLEFSLSRRMTKSAGLTLCPKNIDKIKQEELVIEVRIGVDFFFHYDQLEGNKTVCGIRTDNSLEALQLVFEHEICHVIEFIYFNKSNCKGSRFRTIAANLFGHTESCHKLPTYKQIAGQKLGLRIGDTVYFSYEGKKLEGILYNINKRATVMVRDKRGLLVDDHGNRYSKYYVPLACINLKR